MKVKYILYIIFIISLQYNVGAIPWGLIQSKQLIPFETIDKGSLYGVHAEKKDYIVNNQTEWVAMWNISLYWDNDNPLHPLPYVNFSITTVIGAYFGIKPTGGYSIEVYGIIEMEDTIIIYVREKEPHGIMTLAVTHPYHIVKTKKLLKAVTFIHYIDQSYLIQRDLLRWTLTISIASSIIEIIGVKIYFKQKQRKRNLEG